MNYFEIIVTVFLLHSRHFSETSEALGKLISSAMAHDEKLLERHESMGCKFYCFNNLFPLEKTGVYEKGRVYVFKIRTLEENFANKLCKLLPEVENADFKILACEVKKAERRHIVELYTMTPAIVTIDGQPWLKNDNEITILIDRLQANLEKKHKAFFNNAVETNGGFIQRIEILNKKPVAVRYKGKKMLGNKLKILVNEDDASQKLAFIAEATGIGEKSSSFGAGFCNAAYLK